MDVTVQTGVTKNVSGMSLVSLSLTSKEKERVILCLQVESSPKDAKTLEEECTAIIQSALLETQGESWMRLDGTLKELNGLMKGLMAAEAVSDVHAIVALIEGTNLHVSSAGRGEAYLVRGGTASQITEFTRGKPLSAFVHISSGTLDPQDSIVFSTQRILRSLTPAQLSQVTEQSDDAAEEIVQRLNDDRETAAIAVLQVGGPPQLSAAPVAKPALASRRSEAGRVKQGGNVLVSQAKRLSSLLLPLAVATTKRGIQWTRKATESSQFFERFRDRVTEFFADLKHPVRKKRSHFIILAISVALFLIIFAIVKLTTVSQRSKTKTELGALIQQVTQELQTADNRKLAGDTDAANAILEKADAEAKQVVDNESGYFRVEALNLLDSIRSKREEINNIFRVNPRVVVNLASKTPSVSAQGFLGIADGEFLAYDRQNTYHILLNSVDDPRSLSSDGFIIDGTNFPRYKSQVFLTTGNSVVELQGNQPISMKTDDPAGWMTGKDIESYLRYLYVLTSDDKIEKYERLTNRYSAAVQYNVTGDLTGSLDMTIDSNIFVLKTGGTIMRLFRGESKPFSVSHGPKDALTTATKIFKVTDRDIFLLDPTHSRVIVISDGGTTGNATYLKQYVLEGDQLGKLQDLYVDSDESHLYVSDEKRLYVVDLVK